MAKHIIKDPPKRGTLTKREVRRAVEKVVYGERVPETTTFKVGRDATTGRFIPVNVAEKRKKTAKVETIKRASRH